MPYDIAQPIDINEAIAIQTTLNLYRGGLRKLLTRAQGLHLDGVAESLDDALSYLSDADDGMQSALDNPHGEGM